MKRFLHISLIILFGIAITALMGFIVYEHGRQPINEVKINISKSEDGGFLNEEIIKQLVLSADSIETKKVRELRMQQFEEAIGSNPFVDHVDAFLGINCDLIVNVEERKTLLRVYLPDNKSFYIDKNGYLFPLCAYYAPRTLLANGYIKAPDVQYFRPVTDSAFTDTQLPGLYQLARRISENSFLNSLISQIYVNSKGEYDLIPELGKQTIQLGSLDNLEEKLRNLEAFYRKKIPEEGWDKYETINLMYKNQIVCKKK